MWTEARVRARAETLDLLKLDSLPRALLTLGTPIVAFAATLGLTGQLAIAAVATVAWTVLCGGLIYLGKLIRAPAKIALEKQEELEAERAFRETAEQRQAKRTALALGIDAAEGLKNACGSSLPSQGIADWADTMLALMIELGPEYLARFKSDSGLQQLILTGPDLSDDQRQHWAWLDRRIQRLHEFLNELR